MDKVEDVDVEMIAIVVAAFDKCIVLMELLEENKDKVSRMGEFPSRACAIAISSNERFSLLPLDLEIERTLSRIRRARRDINLELDSEIEGEMAYNHTLIQLQARFGGTSVEDTYAHLERFLPICDTFKVNEKDALEWLDDLPTGSITTWTELVQTFLNKYFPPTKMAKLFSDIISYRKKDRESLHAAWIRFKKMLRMCPQHNLTQSQQTQTFYNGADPSVRSMLDAAANGCFFRKTPAEAWEIIGNMADSNIGWPDVKKEKKVGILDVDVLMALNAKIDALTNQVALMKVAPKTQVQGNLPEEHQLFEVEAANFAGNQGRQPFNSYNNNYNQNWQLKKEEKKPIFEEIVMKYVAGTEARLQNQEAMLQKLETQMAQIATQLSTRPTGALPSNTERNPRCLNAIMVVNRSQSEKLEQQRDEENTMEGPKSSELKKDARTENSSMAGRKDVLAQMPNYARFFKDLLKNKKKLNDIMQVIINEECSAVLKNKLPTKSQDPGSFSIPCHIGSLSFDNVLCDLGSSINLMSHALAKKLGICNTEPVSISLKFADGSIKYPMGVVENVLVNIDKFIYLVDFVILDMDENFEVLLILGRPFLAMNRALVDVKKRELVLRLNDEQVVFHMFKSASDISNLKSCSAVNFIDVINYVGECQQV
ncbi:uncharacterized protein [Henckelia pumila]|uniref:uncharacterized protein n=1 Tax=Henckelia pumila TaxID=405737 RepID=UPI003C6DC5E2